jgi:hypothetical protein
MLSSHGSLAGRVRCWWKHGIALSLTSHQAQEWCRELLHSFTLQLMEEEVVNECSGELNASTDQN